MTKDFWHFALGGGGHYFEGDIIQQGGVMAIGSTRLKIILNCEIYSFENLVRVVVVRECTYYLG